MKWHSVNITIAAALLITLPYDGNSAHCDAVPWNHALKLQRDLDHSFNFHATRFNQFLQIHQTQPFLYQEFTTQQLQILWQSGNQQFVGRMQSQSDASAQVIERINKERTLLTPLRGQALDQQQRWATLSDHCLTAGSQANAITSKNYANTNQILMTDIDELIEKLDVLESRYKMEIDALEKTKPKPESP